MSYFTADRLSALSQALPGAASLRTASTAQTPVAAPQAFAEVLRQHAAPSASEIPGAADSQALREKHADKAAGDLISNALILPMLKQLRRSPWSENTVFAPGMGEKTFGPQFDMQISDRIAHSPRLGLKAALAQRLLKRGAAAAAAPGSGSDAARTIHARPNLHG